MNFNRTYDLNKINKEAIKMEKEAQRYDHKLTVCFHSWKVLNITIGTVYRGGVPYFAELRIMECTHCTRVWRQILRIARKKVLLL